jgi:hypothetical protein
MKLGRSNIKRKCCKKSFSNPAKELKKIHNYWVFELFPLSGILETRKNDVLEFEYVSETSCFLFPTIPDDGKSPKNSNSECYTPSSEPYRIYL